MPGRVVKFMILSENLEKPSMILFYKFERLGAFIKNQDILFETP